MTLQTATPFEHHTLHPSFRTALSLLDAANRGELDLTPPYQREDVWTLEQRIALVESWLRGLPAGVVYISDRTHDGWNDRRADGVWEACIDGKQRITTAAMWYRNEFAVPATWFRPGFVATTEATADGPYVRNRDLTDRGRRFFERYASLFVAPVRFCTSVADEARFYLLVNGGGTAQSEAAMTNAATVADGPLLMPLNQVAYDAMRDGTRRPGLPCCLTAGPVPHWPMFLCRGGNGPGRPIQPHCTCPACF